MNGRLCSDIKLESVKKDKKDDKPKAEEGEGDEGKDGAATVGPKPQLQEKFVLDPQFLALFASDGSGKDQTPRGAARRPCSLRLLAALVAHPVSVRARAAFSQASRSSTSA